jgi:hypothetical protein
MISPISFQGDLVPKPESLRRVGSGWLLTIRRLLSGFLEAITLPQDVLRLCSDSQANYQEREQDPIQCRFIEPIHFCFSP